MNRHNRKDFSSSKNLIFDEVLQEDFYFIWNWKNQNRIDYSNISEILRNDEMKGQFEGGMPPSRVTAEQSGLAHD